MKQVALIVLHLPDGRLVMQRRTKDAPISPNKLGFFGGHIEPGESPAVAARRELQEETSLRVNDLQIKFEKQLDMDSAADPSGTQTQINVFSTLINSGDFEVYEGIGAETYPYESLIAHKDLGATARYVLEHVALTRLN